MNMEVFVLLSSYLNFSLYGKFYFKYLIKKLICSLDFDFRSKYLIQKRVSCILIPQEGLFEKLENFIGSAIFTSQSQYSPIYNK